MGSAGSLHKTTAPEEDVQHATDHVRPASVTSPRNAPSRQELAEASGAGASSRSDATAASRAVTSLNIRYTTTAPSRVQFFGLPPRQPSWKTVNFAGKVPGWTRFAPAQEWLDRHQRESKELRTSFDEFLDAKRKGRELSAAERERLFREFQQWQRAK